MKTYSAQRTKSIDYIAKNDENNIQICYSFNATTLQQNSARFNTVYGGLNPSITNALFVHGQYDPWRSAGVQSDLSASAQAIVIVGASQGNDLGPISEGKHNYSTRYA